MQTCLYAIGVDLYFSYKKPLPRGSRKKLSAAVQRACTPHASHCQACNPHLQRFPALARTQSPRVSSLKLSTWKPCIKTRDQQAGLSPESYSVPEPDCVSHVLLWCGAL